MSFTLEDARVIAGQVVRHDRLTGDPARDTPLIGKEHRLLEAMRGAEIAHNEALDFAENLPKAKGDALKLISQFERTLRTLDETTINLAAIDPDLDRSDENPANNNDLRGLLRRAIIAAKNFLLDVPDDKTRRIRTPKKSGATHGQPKTDGLAALVEKLRIFWEEETSLPFTEGVDVRVETDGRTVPATLATMFVYLIAQSVDPAYTVEQCSNAMRPR